jgi:hypothetical protein
VRFGGFMKQVLHLLDPFVHRYPSVLTIDQSCHGIAQRGPQSSGSGRRGPACANDGTDVTTLIKTTE